jgi:hypothetical protein
MFYIGFDLSLKGSLVGEHLVIKNKNNDQILEIINNHVHLIA